jgi:hypothetical protein
MPNPMLPDTQIGGAYVRRRFDLGPRTMTAGETLTAEQVLAIPKRNRQALINLGKIELYPASPVAAGSRRFAIHMGMGRFDVIEGHKLNAVPMSREEAEAMLPAADRPKGRKPKKKKPAAG